MLNDRIQEAIDNLSNVIEQVMDDESANLSSLRDILEEAQNAASNISNQIDDVDSLIRDALAQIDDIS